MSEIDPWKVARWILIVLAAGFIGQFGKTLASHILRRIRERGGNASAGESPPAGGGTFPAAGPGETAGAPAVPGKPGEDPRKIAKRRKKELKALAKIKKKGAGGKEGGGIADGPTGDGDGR